MYTRARNRTIKKKPSKFLETCDKQVEPHMPLSSFIIQCEQNMKKSHKRRPAQFVDDMTVIL